MLKTKKEDTIDFKLIGLCQKPKEKEIIADVGWVDGNVSHFQQNFQFSKVYILDDFEAKTVKGYSYKQNKFFNKKEGENIELSYDYDKYYDNQGRVIKTEYFLPEKTRNFLESLQNGDLVILDIKLPITAEMDYWEKDNRKKHYKLGCQFRNAEINSCKLYFN